MKRFKSHIVVTAALMLAIIAVWSWLKKKADDTGVLSTAEFPATKESPSDCRDHRIFTASVAHKYEVPGQSPTSTNDPLRFEAYAIVVDEDSVAYQIVFEDADTYKFYAIFHRDGHLLRLMSDSADTSAHERGITLRNLLRIFLTVSQPHEGNEVFGKSNERLERGAFGAAQIAYKMEGGRVNKSILTLYESPASPIAPRIASSDIRQIPGFFLPTTVDGAFSLALTSQSKEPIGRVEYAVAADSHPARKKLPDCAQLTVAELQRRHPLYVVSMELEAPVTSENPVTTRAKNLSEAEVMVVINMLSDPDNRDVFYDAFSSLVDAIRSDDNIPSIIARKFKSSAKDYEQARNLLFILGDAGTPAAEKILLSLLDQLIQDSKFVPDDVRQPLQIDAIRSTQSIARPSHDVVEKLRDLKGRNDQSSETLTATTFALGTTAHNVVDNGLRSDVNSELWQDYQNASEKRTKLITLEAIGNLGHVASLRGLKDLYATEMSPDLRPHIVASVRNIPGVEAELFMIDVLVKDPAAQEATEAFRGVESRTVLSWQGVSALVDAYRTIKTNPGNKDITDKILAYLTNENLSAYSDLVLPLLNE